MKVKELAGKINIKFTHHTMFRFIDHKTNYFLSNRISIHNAFNYWGNFSVVTFYTNFDYIKDTILIDVFIDPDERRTTANDNQRI